MHDSDWLKLIIRNTLYYDGAGVNGRIERKILLFGKTVDFFSVVHTCTIVLYGFKTNMIFHYDDMLFMYYPGFTDNVCRRHVY